MLALHLGACLAYFAPLQRPYALTVSTDRTLGVAMARGVMNGLSPFGHVQIEFSNLEPLWTFLVGSLARLSPEHVNTIYDCTALVTLTLTALGFAAIGGWRGAFIAGGALGWSSLSLTGSSRLLDFWSANFLFKPNHSLAFGLLGLLIPAWAASRRGVRVGLLLGVLFWVFILDWAYVLPGLAIAALVSPNRKAALKRAITAIAISLVLGLPYLFHLLRDYSPTKASGTQIWTDALGGALSSPFWWTIDLLPVWLAFAFSATYAWRERSEKPMLLGVLAAVPVVTLAYIVTLSLGIGAEPDEGYYFVRLLLGGASGDALWRLSTLAGRNAATSERVRGALFGLLLAVSFPSLNDPTTDERYYTASLQPLDAGLQEACDWINTHVPKDAVLVAKGNIAVEVPGLTGRRVLLLGRRRPPSDMTERMRAERDIIESMDGQEVLRAAERWDVTWLVLDQETTDDFDPEPTRGLGRRPWFEPGLANRTLRVIRIRREWRP